MKVFIAGHKGMVGSAITRRVKKIPEVEILLRSRTELDLSHQAAVADFMATEKPDVVILAAAKVGGIHANNTYPAQFIYENLMIQSNVIHSAHINNVQKLLFLGSSCIYPRDAQQPIAEEALLGGTLEATNEPYAIAKIAGIKICESYNRQYGRDYRSIMPTNLYGPGDNFHPENSHVLPALIRRFHEAVENEIESVMIWGSGHPRREFMHVDDMADAALFVLGLDRAVYESNTSIMSSHVNVGVGSDLSILELAQKISKVIGFKGVIVTDPSKPDGTMRKLMDNSKLRNMGWSPRIQLEEGLRRTYDWFLRTGSHIRT